jgi:hypothetical protein
MSMTEKKTDRVREYAHAAYIEPARRRNEPVVRIVAGEVQKAVGLTNRVPLVCQALRSKKFLQENNLVLEAAEGPRSGMSTTVAFTYRLLGGQPEGQNAPRKSGFLELRGIAKDVFQSLGGGEAFIRRQREHFDQPEED